MKVTVLKPGVYAGPEWVSLPLADAGATINIQGGWYAQSMIDGGYVAAWVEAPVSDEAPVKKKAVK
jgi:hypothetical protein